MADIVEILVSRSDKLSHDAADEIIRLRRIFKATKLVLDSEIDEQVLLQLRAVVSAANKVA